MSTKNYAALAVAVAVIGCGEAVPTSLVVPPANLGFISGPPGFPTTTRSAQAELVEVCKDYVMTTSATPPTANFTANGNAFSLTNGACKEVWVTGAAGEDVTVTETAIPGYITTHKVTDLASNVTGPTAGLSVTVHPAGSPPAGFLIEFINTEEYREEGCTLTQGYWKTHSSYGPAPADNAGWAVVGGPDAVFFSSGQSWYEIFWTPPKKGNAYLQLAHQYMAAKLNILNGASSTAAVDAAITYAEAFFPGKTPHTHLTKAQVTDVRDAAEVLGAYNEGLEGPGHCQSN